MDPERHDTNSYTSSPDMCKCHPGYTIDGGTWGCESNVVGVSKPNGFTLEWEHITYMIPHYYNPYWTYDSMRYELNDLFVLQKYFESVGKIYDTSFGCEFKRDDWEWWTSTPDTRYQRVYTNVLNCNQNLKFNHEPNPDFCRYGTEQLVHPACTVNIDDCAEVNCNSGECIDLTDAYRCKCDVGYYGEHCENLQVGIWVIQNVQLIIIL